MIYDTLDRIGEYRGMGEWLDRAIDFLENTDMERLPSGRTEIAGTDCFINVMETVTKEETQADFEVHRKYMDIQIDLEGMEEIQIGGTTEGENFPTQKKWILAPYCVKRKRPVSWAGVGLSCAWRENRTNRVWRQENRAV